jgi:putative ABC transport system permease protein
LLTISQYIPAMIINYLRVAFRNLWRHKSFSLLNIIGLTVGITAFFLIFLYVCFELGYDSMHSKADRIYRIVSDVNTPTETLHYNAPPAPATIHMAAELPEVQTAVRIGLGDNWMVIRGDQVFEQEDVATADSTFFKVFDFPLLKGDPKTALREPFSIVLTEPLRKRSIRAGTGGGIITRTVRTSCSSQGPMLHVSRQNFPPSSRKWTVRICTGGK